MPPLRGAPRPCFVQRVTEVRVHQSNFFEVLRSGGQLQVKKSNKIVVWGAGKGGCHSMYNTFHTPLNLYQLSVFQGLLHTHTQAEVLIKWCQMVLIEKTQTHTWLRAAQ